MVSNTKGEGKGFVGEYDGDPASLPGQRSTLKRAMFKLRSKGGIKVSRAVGGEGRLCSVFWVGGTGYVKVWRGNPMVFKKQKKTSEPRAWGVQRVVGDWAGNNKGRNQTMGNLWVILRSVVTESQILFLGVFINSFKHHNSVIQVLLAPFCWWGSQGSKKLPPAQRHRRRRW